MLHAELNFTSYFGVIYKYNDRSHIIIILILYCRNKSPLTLKYIKIIRSFLRPPGGWPSEVFGEKLSLAIRFHRVTLPFHTSLIVIGGFYHLYDNVHRLSFLEFGHIIITTLLAMVTVVSNEIMSLYVSLERLRTTTIRIRSELGFR